MNNIVLPIGPKRDLLVEVKTGDKKGAGTDCKIWFILHDDQGRVSSPFRLPNRFSKNTRNSTSQFRFQSKMVDLKNIVLLEFWIEKFGIGTLWYVEYFKITNVYNGKTFAFPYHRWVKPNAGEHLFIALNDASLPQDTTHEVLRKQRADELRNKRQEYRYKQHIDDGPMQAAFLPEDEMFSEEYYWNFAKEKANLIMKANVTKWTTKKWRSFEELKKLTKKSLGEPDCMHHWDVDEWFGYQRVQGLNPFIIRLCKKIPENFNISENTVSGLLEDLSLEEAIEKNRIFICDLKILENIPCPDGRKIAVPLALFFLNKENKILPVAIQLFQQQGDENPVYTPKDPFNTWLLAKIFYNNAEAQHHQGVSHLGLTHLLMEGICICSHRQLSPSHPVFRLMAPHFLFLMAINTRGLEKLISPGGWVDSCMTQGVYGIYEVIRRGFQQHNFLLYGDVRKELESRGVLDKNVLPYYPYRDDAVSLYQIIEKYVSKVLTRHYDSEEKLINDFELQEWRIELTKKKEIGGVGILGVPGDDVKGYSNLKDLIDTITIIISTCSLGHAATNFQQYDQYGFVPNYPGMLMRDPPQDKREYCDEELLEYLPNMEMTLSTMVITKLLSKRGTNSLGHFEVQYLYSEEDVQAADEFRKDLENLSLDIKKRNVDREKKFFILDPEIVPNSISI